MSYLQSFLTSGVFYNWLPRSLQIDESVAQVGLMGAIHRALKILLGAEGWLFVLGGLFILVTLLFPDGMVGAWRKILAHRADRLTGLREDSAAAAAEDGSLVSGKALAAEVNR